jgi:hypothetical protein
LPLEPPGRLVVHVSDEGGVPCAALGPRDVRSDRDRVDGHAPAESQHGAHRFPFSATATELELTNGPHWPLQRAVPRGAAATDERVTSIARLRPGTWRVRLGYDPLPAAQLPFRSFPARPRNSRCVGPSDRHARRRGLIVTNSTTAAAARHLVQAATILIDPRERCLRRVPPVVRRGRARRSSRGASILWKVRSAVLGRPARLTNRFPAAHERRMGRRNGARRRAIDPRRSPPVALEYEVRLRSGTYGASRSFIGELHAALPVSEGLLMTVSAPGFGSSRFRRPRCERRVGEACSRSS